MNRRGYSAFVAFGLVTVASVLGQYSQGLAQSWWPFGENQEQDKIKAQQQAPLEQAFSQHYWQLTDEQRTLAGKQYEEYLKSTKYKDALRSSTQGSTDKGSTDKDPSSPLGSSTIQPLKLPKNLFELSPPQDTLSNRDTSK